MTGSKLKQYLVESADGKRHIGVLAEGKSQAKRLAVQKYGLRQPVATLIHPLSPKEDATNRIQAVVEGLRSLMEKYDVTLEWDYDSTWFEADGEEFHIYEM